MGVGGAQPIAVLDNSREYTSHSNSVAHMQELRSFPAHASITHAHSEEEIQLHREILVRPFLT